MDNKLTLEDFRRKALNNKKNKLMVKEIEIEGFGKVPFKRPTDDDSLEYLNLAARAVKANKNGEIVDSNISLLATAAKELVYKCCDYLHDNELQEEYECEDPYDIVFKIFGISETMDLAEKLIDGFDAKEVKEDIKN